MAGYINNPSEVAKWARFAKDHIDDPAVQKILSNNFDELANGIIKKEYGKLDVPHKLTGSIAVNFKDQITASLKSIGLEEENIEVVSASPIQLLAKQYVQ